MSLCFHFDSALKPFISKRFIVSRAQGYDDQSENWKVQGSIPGFAKPLTSGST